MSLLLASALLAAAAGLVVTLPILTRRAAVLRDVTAGRILDAEARKRVVLSELKELEYEFLGGKLDENDYRELHEKLTAEAVAAVRMAESVRASVAPPGIVPAAGGAGSYKHSATSSGADRAGWIAHSCGFANPDESRFCAGCGARLH